MVRPRLVDTSGYVPSTVEKVERLAELIGEIDAHPFLGQHLRLHGGTALNLFHLKLPRLSVDADYTFVGHVDPDRLPVIRDDVVRALTSLTKALGYPVIQFNEDPDEHGGKTGHLQYPGGHIKIDLNFMNRSPLLETPRVHSDGLTPACNPRTLSLPDLVGGKVAALFDRCEFRDLYDLHRVSEMRILESWAKGDGDSVTLIRRVALHYVARIHHFPCEIDHTRLSVFVQRRAEMDSRLAEVIRETEQVDIETLVESVGALIDEVFAPRDEDEKEYLRRLAVESRDCPELIFGQWPEVEARARVNPAIGRKVDNLRRRPAVLSDVAGSGNHTGSTDDEDAVAIGRIVSARYANALGELSNGP